MNILQIGGLLAVLNAILEFIFLKGYLWGIMVLITFVLYLILAYMDINGMADKQSSQKGEKK